MVALFSLSLIFLLLLRSRARILSPLSVVTCDSLPILNALTYTLISTRASYLRASLAGRASVEVYHARSPSLSLRLSFAQRIWPKWYAVCCCCCCGIVEPFAVCNINCRIFAITQLLYYIVFLSFVIANAIDFFFF